MFLVGLVRWWACCHQALSLCFAFLEQMVCCFVPGWFVVLCRALDDASAVWKRNRSTNTFFGCRFLSAPSRTTPRVSSARRQRRVKPENAERATGEPQVSHMCRVQRGTRGGWMGLPHAVRSSVGPVVKTFHSCLLTLRLWS